MLRELPDADDVATPEPFAGPDHPMRKVTRQVAFENRWSSGRADRVAELFDSLAAEWSTNHVDDLKAAPVRDALARGGVDPGGSWAELGSGTGAGTRVLMSREMKTRVDRFVAVDLSAQMLANAPDLAPKVRADASVLPFPSDSFDTVLLINMLLFPTEIERILRPDGSLIWINTLGDQTPIHLPPADVVQSLPGSWSGATARSGTGLWAVLSRD